MWPDEGTWSDDRLKVGLDAGFIEQQIPSLPLSLSFTDLVSVNKSDKSKEFHPGKLDLFFPGSSRKDLEHTSAPPPLSSGMSASRLMSYFTVGCKIHLSFTDSCYCTCTMPLTMQSLLGPQEQMVIINY